MSSLSSEAAALLIGAGFCALATLAVWRRVRGGTLLGLAGGLHLNVLLFYGLGMLAYPIAPPMERVADVTEFMVSAGGPLLAGYAVAVGWELWRARGAPARQGSVRLADEVSPGLALAFLAMATVGYFGSTLEVSAAGIGTLLPVLKMFWYPAATISVAIVSRRKPRTLLLLLLALGLPAYSGLLSGWRSELLSLSGSVVLGLTLRNQRAARWAPLAVAAMVLILLPFVQLKKVEYERVQADPAAAFAETLFMPLDERLAFATQFWGVRVNGARELAFVERALETGQIVLRGGETYGESILQLVPRVLWPEKPSYNTITNYYLARQIGLVHWDDDSTSWAVNVYAEALWNFGAWHLLWFAPLLFLLAAVFDRLVRRQVRSAGVAWFVGTALFFHAMTIVTIVNAMTFLVWCVLIGVIVDRLLSRRAPARRQAACRVPA